MIGIEDRVKISPASWPPRAKVAPGDLTQYAPIGLGLGTPMVMMPWNDLEDTLSHGSFYGSYERTGDPFRDAPVNGPSGGLIYFDGNADQKRFAQMLEFLNVHLYETKYAVYAAESSKPKVDRYLAQIRVVRYVAMHLFGADLEPGEKAWEQPISIGQLIGAFLKEQLAVWGHGQSRELGGTLGGDGDYACETLSFGFMIENGYNGVYRLWSRPWIVTK